MTQISQPDDKKLSVLLLCDNHRYHPNHLINHITVFTGLSKHNIYIFNPRWLKGSLLIELNEFDVIILHYSLVIIKDGYLAPEFRKKIRNYNGLKIQFIQDEYRWVDQSTAMMRHLGVHVLFTCYPENKISKVYEKRLPETIKKNTLCGYIPDNILKIKALPIEERPIDIGYRGRILPYWMGQLGQEKMWIGQGILKRAEEYGLHCDIKWREEDRIFGESWNDFLGSCKATLGVESGASITDFDGSLQRKVDEYLAEHPNADFFEVQREILAPYENNLPINVISPKFFEAIALRTALILFPGEYSGILKPWIHYIPLAKDFSNMDEVVEKLNDIEFLRTMTQRAYEDIVASGKYSYRAFIKEFDDIVSKYAKPHQKTSKIKIKYRLAQVERLIRLLFLNPYTIHPKYYFPKGSLYYLLYPLFMLSFLVKGCYRVGLKSLYFMYTLLSPFIWQVYWITFSFRDSVPRKILFQYLRQGPKIWKKISLKSITTDLLRLGIIKQIQKGGQFSAETFQIITEMDSQKGQVIFTSSYDTLVSNYLEERQKLFWLEFEEKLQEGSIQQIQWDHSSVNIPLQGKLFRRFKFLELQLPKTGYHFDNIVKFYHLLNRAISKKLID